MKTNRQTVLDIQKIIADSHLEIMGRIQEKLRLTLVREKMENGNLCFANTPEVRDEYRETLDGEDLLYYMYAALHAPSYRGNYRNLSKIDLFQVAYPEDYESFWKLVGPGAQLRRLHLLKPPMAKKFDAETDIVLKKIAEIEIE